MQRHERHAQRLVRDPGAKSERVGHDDRIAPSRFPLDVAIQRRRDVANRGCEDAKRADWMPELRMGGGFVELRSGSDRQERQPESLEQWREVRVGGDGNDVSALAKSQGDGHERMHVTRASDRRDEHPHCDTYCLAGRLDCVQLGQKAIVARFRLGSTGNIARRDLRRRGIGSASQPEKDLHSIAPKNGLARPPADIWRCR